MEMEERKEGGTEVTRSTRRKINGNIFEHFKPWFLAEPITASAGGWCVFFLLPSLPVKRPYSHVLVNSLKLERLLRQAEEFVDTFEKTYVLLESRVGEASNIVSGSGGVARKRIPWKAPPRIMGGSEPAPPPLPASLSGALTEQQIEEMDVSAVRRALIALGLPSSGRLSVVKQRLKDAQRN
ncbi:hypothetical protein R1sor_023188 [Riccia sorocarpa]|uniref:SAP domain-containing protein n=1 Tax=Riccia sorocarpa TaxID=122646 RepID=A0ABD3GP30_9MARC